MAPVTLVPHLELLIFSGRKAVKVRVKAPFFMGGWPAGFNSLPHCLHTAASVSRDGSLPECKTFPDYHLIPKVDQGLCVYFHVDMIRDMSGQRRLLTHGW